MVKLFEALIKDKKQEQVVFYDPGVGTFPEKAFIFAPLRWFGRLLGDAFGIGLQKNRKDAYAYLMDVYEDGDKIFLFGFSRGAHTVRRLATMLDECWLLQLGRWNHKVRWSTGLGLVLSLLRLRDSQAIGEKVC